MSISYIASLLSHESWWSLIIEKFALSVVAIQCVLNIFSNTALANQSAIDITKVAEFERLALQDLVRCRETLRIASRSDTLWTDTELAFKIDRLDDLQSCDYSPLIFAQVYCSLDNVSQPVHIKKTGNKPGQAFQPCCCMRWRSSDDPSQECWGPPISTSCWQTLHHTNWHPGHGQVMFLISSSSWRSTSIVRTHLGGEEKRVAYFKYFTSGCNAHRRQLSGMQKDVICSSSNIL